MSTIEDEVWAPGDAEPLGEPVPGEPRAAGELPEIIPLFTATIEDLMAHFAGYLLAGLGAFLVSMVIGTVGAGALLVLVFLPTIAGLALDSEIVATLGPIIGGLAGFMLFLGVSIVLAYPITASLGRNLKDRIETGAELGFTAPYNRIAVDLGQVLLLALVTAAGILVGMLMCYLPALLVGLFLGFALPAMIVHRLSAVEAVKLSVGHVKDHFVWHLGYWGLGLAIMLAGQAVPLIGPVLMIPVYTAYQVRVYMAVFGTGEAPGEALAA